MKRPPSLSLTRPATKQQEIRASKTVLMATKHDGNHPEIRVTRTVSVYPKSLHPQQVLTLSNLDRQCPVLMYLVLFYKPSCANYQNLLSLDSVFSSLKSGLEETLSVWYPAAGRLSVNPIDGKLNLWCNNSGVVLVEAVSRAMISDFGDLSQYNEFFENLVHKPVFNGNISDMPLFVAQVTRFGCGGYSIGIGASHSLFDGPATYKFLRSWASNSAVLKEKGEGAESQNPAHGRERLMAVGNFTGISSNLQPKSTATNSLTRAAAIDHLYQLIKQQAAAAGCGTGNLKLGTQAGNPNYVLKTFHLNGAMIESLKTKLFGESRGSFSCSSFELVAAHLWKARTKALGLGKGTLVCLQFAVDIRNKIVPPLPEGFSGNAYVLASVALTTGELEEGSYGAIVEKIKEAKNSVGNDYVNAYMEALDASKGSLPPLRELTLISDWTRMPFYKVDFLHGEAAYASPLVSPIPQVAYFMQNPTDFRGIDVRIGLPPEILDSFSRYFRTN